MKVPISWLQEFIPLTESAEEIAKLLTSAGLEVDKIEEKRPNFSDVVVAEVLTAEPCPNSDRLTLARVTDGTDTYSVVCGASNCRAGIRTYLAKVGASLPGEKGEPFKIKKGKIRGVESHGMLCTLEELRLAKHSEGIAELDTTLPLGTDVASLFSDTILDISLTPNLGHCLSILGIARELSALLNRPLTLPPASLLIQKGEEIQISIQNPEECFHYSTLVIKNVRNFSIPSYVKERLEKAGLHSSHPIVDVTNFVMLELGQPLHAFDLDRLPGREIVIKNLPQGTSFKALMHKEYILPSQALGITCKDEVLALAGIMGGDSSAITEETQNIVLESAHFSSMGVRRTSKALNLRSESSNRFEKGVDPAGVDIALARALFLLGGTYSSFASTVPVPLHPRKITCHLSHMDRLIGIHIPMNEATHLLKRLQIPCSILDNDRFDAIIPSFRNDLQIEVDIIEEIARIYGYHHIPERLDKVSLSKAPNNPTFSFEKKLRSRLVGERLQEFLCCDLISRDMAKGCCEEILTEDNLLSVMQPQSQDASTLRPSLLPGLLLSLKHNFNFHEYDIQAFEMGRIHFKLEGECKEPSTLGIILTGRHAPENWATDKREVDFFDLKGIIQNIVPPAHYSLSHFRTFHPYAQAEIFVKKLKIGVMGQVHPALLKQYGIEKNVFFAEINIHELILVEEKTHQMIPLPEYPGSDRDVTFTADDSRPLGEMIAAVLKTHSSLLKRVQLLGIFKSDKLGPGKKNVTLRFHYRHDDKTLDFETVEKEHQRILSLLIGSLSS